MGSFIRGLAILALLMVPVIVGFTIGLYAMWAAVFRDWSRRIERDRKRMARERWQKILEREKRGS